MKERKYGEIIAQFQFLTYFRENIALSTINLLLVEVFTRCQTHFEWESFHSPLLL